MKYLGLLEEDKVDRQGVEAPQGVKLTTTNKSQAYLKQRANFGGAKRRAKLCESLTQNREAILRSYVLSH